MKSRWIGAAVVAVGAGDAATGVLLFTSPTTVVELLRVAELPAGAAVFLRWIGVFVLAVGCAYLLPFTAPEPERSARLRGALRWTALARLLVAAFVAGAVASGELGEGWSFVGIYDGLVAVAQLGLLARGFFGVEMRAEPGAAAERSP